MLLANKTILITGGTGSLGSTLVRRILGGELGLPGKVIVLSRDEAKQHEMRLQYRNVGLLEFRIGDIRDFPTLRSAVKDVHIVIHAAALKQVPACEYFPTQAVLTNVTGAANLVRAIEENGASVETVVGISTDKACKPVNVMGMTKSLQERIFTAANLQAPNTRFVCVRYGNVLASRGSVIPLFLDQIAAGGPVTVTVPGMTRFLLSLDIAVDTVFNAIRHGRKGETLVPRAPAATVQNIAEALIGDRDIPIVCTGIRPGEKMHESLVSEEEAAHTYPRGEYFAIQPMLPELVDRPETEPPMQKAFSSDDRVLSLQGTIDLLAVNRMLPEHVAKERLGGSRPLLR